MPFDADILEELVNDVIPTIGGEVAGCHTQMRRFRFFFLIK